MWCGEFIANIILCMYVSIYWLLFFTADKLPHLLRLTLGCHQTLCNSVKPETPPSLSQCEKKNAFTCIGFCLLLGKPSQCFCSLGPSSGEIALFPPNQSVHRRIGLPPWPLGTSRGRLADNGADVPRLSRLAFLSVLSVCGSTFSGTWVLLSLWQLSE